MTNMIAMLSFIVAGANAGQSETAQETLVRRSATPASVVQPAERRAEIVTEGASPSRARSLRQMHAAELAFAVADAPAEARASGFTGTARLVIDGPAVP